MSLNRTKAWLAGGLLSLLVAAPAWSQGLQDAQLFAPAAVSDYGGGPRPNEGAFFTIDYLRWTIQAPEVTTIGNPGLLREVWYSPTRSIVQGNTLDTGSLASQWTDGNRIEFGDVCGHHGWFFSGFWLNSQNQWDTFSGVDMTFDDKEYGQQGHKHLEGVVADYIIVDPDSEEGEYTGFVLKDLPVSFDSVRLENHVKTWGVEWNYLLRLHPNHYGGILEVFCGARYLEFNEKFSVDARGERFLYAGSSDDDQTPVGIRTLLSDSNWITNADNHVVGPQLGARYFRQNGRWTLSTEGRVFAGFNQQNIRQRGTLGSHLDDPPPGFNGIPYGADYYPYVPLTMQPTSFNHVDHESEWSPAFEVRIEAKYQLTRALTARFGWDVFWIEGIARSSDLIDYTLSENSVMGILTRNNRQDVLMQGWHIGLEVNR